MAEISGKMISKKSVTLIQKAIDAGNRPYFYSRLAL
jgi:hypothetical protein